MHVTHATQTSGLLKSMSSTPSGVGTPFSTVMAARSGAADRSSMKGQDLARQTAQELVATALVQPLLARLRHDPLKSDLFHGGQAEDIFGQQLDTILSDRIVQGSRLPVVDAVYRTLMQRGRQAVDNSIDLIHCK